MTDEEIYQIWKDTPSQGDPSGKMFAIEFAKNIIKYNFWLMRKGEI